MNKRAKLLRRRLSERGQAVPKAVEPAKETLSLANQCGAARVLVLAETDYGEIFIFESDKRSRALAQEVVTAFGGIKP